jgi:nucleotide-binding universal stress UspA family protein
MPMLSISKVLLPVDFSERSLAILPTVRVIAQKYGAEITLLHVVDPFYMIPATGFSGPVLIPVSKEELAAREQRMEQFAAAELHGLRVQRAVYEGDAVSQIVGFAKAAGFQLIAMPTRGHSALRRFLLGSVASKVLHDTDCPVLTSAHAPEAVATASHVSKILCAVDLGPQSQNVLTWGKQLAQDFGGELHIVHAVAALDSELPIDAAPNFQLQLEALVRKDVEQIQQLAGCESAKVKLVGGGPSRAVCAYAASIHADLLVIGRGPRDAHGGRLPANSYAIIRQSPCPFISV